MFIPLAEEGGGEVGLGRMMKKALVAIMAVLLSGCAGTNALKISSVPGDARLYANGEYLGMTPRSAPSKWWTGGGDSVMIRVEKDGYKAVEKTIPWSELNHRWWQGDFLGGSEFGLGNTFLYTIHLEKDAEKPAVTEEELFWEIAEVPVTAYEYDHKTRKGKLSVDIEGKGIGVRQWILKHIGEICSSKNVLLEAGKESDEGGRYRVLNESVRDNILTIEFEAEF